MVLELTILMLAFIAWGYGVDIFRRFANAHRYSFMTTILALLCFLGCHGLAFYTLGFLRGVGFVAVAYALGTAFTVTILSRYRPSSDWPDNFITQIAFGPIISFSMSTALLIVFWLVRAT